MTTLRLIGMGVGAIKVQGTVAAMVNRLRFDDGSERLVSWGIPLCAHLMAAVLPYVSQLSVPEEETPADIAFKHNSPLLSHDDLNHPPLESVASEIVGFESHGDFNLRLFFPKTEETLSLTIGKDEMPSFMGFTSNTLQHFGLLDRVMEQAATALTPSSILLYSCEFTSNGEVHYNNFGDYDKAHYTSLQNLYSVAIIDNSKGRSVIGGFFVKTRLAETEPAFSDIAATVADTLNNVTPHNRPHISFVTQRVNVPDAEPVTEQEMLNHLIEQYTRYTAGGSA